jgi:Xaa-Pro aminopeptidase
MALTESLVNPDVFGQRRVDAAREAENRGLRGLLVWGRGGETGESVNDILFYANHFSAYPGQPPQPPFLTAIEHAALIIGPGGKSILLATEFVSKGVQVDEVRLSHDLVSLIPDALRDAGLTEGRVGLIASEAFPYPVGIQLNSTFPGLALEPADDIATTQRMRLSPTDLPMLQNAADVGTAIVQAIVDAAAPGVTEGEAVGAGLAVAAQAPGCIHWAFMISSGPDANLFVRDGTPAWDPTYVYKAGDVLHIDAYGFVFGYMYDLMRTVVVGAEPSPEQAAVITASRDLLADIAGMLKPGVTPRSLRDSAAALAAERGLDVSGNATFGHGINLGWAGPWLQEPMDRPDADVPIEPPYAFAFETFLNDGLGHYSKWEEMYAWTADGVIRLTGGGPRDQLRAPLLPF